MISSFGLSGFSVFHAGHWLWQRPHSVQLAKSSMPFQLKSSILPMPSFSKSSSSRSSIASMSTGLPRTVIGLIAPSAIGTTAEHDVQRRDEDVQVLGVAAR